MKHKLSVGAVFRNESHSIVEWIQHYLANGADHFYLINDDSTDNSVEIIQPYVDSGVVTLFNTDWGRVLRDQCKENGVPFFFKQVDKVISIPDDLKILEFPKYHTLKNNINMKNTNKTTIKKGNLRVMKKEKEYRKAIYYHILENNKK